MQTIIETIRPLYSFIFSFDWYVGVLMGFAVGYVTLWIRWKKGWLK
jgi:hypothetical protein